MIGAALAVALAMFAVSHWQIGAEAGADGGGQVAGWMIIAGYFIAATLGAIGGATLGFSLAVKWRLKKLAKRALKHGAKTLARSGIEHFASDKE